MTNADHLTNALLVRAIDDELTDSEAALVGVHLSQCRECKQKYEELGLLSSRLGTLILDIETGGSHIERESLEKKLELHQQSAMPVSSAEKVLQRFGWGMAIAAALAIGITFAPHMKQIAIGQQPALSQSRGAGTFEVDGETFVALPYSNADLPLSGPHIVQMRIPVSALASAGVIFQPISSELSGGDDSVLADVLLGIDGQPLGVHVAAVE